MEGVFTRWPSRTQQQAGSARGTVGELHAWLVATPPSPWRKRLTATAGALLVVVLSCATVLVAGLAAGTGHPSALPLAIVAAAAAAAAVAQVHRLRRTAATRCMRYKMIFERAGISTWLED